MEAEAPAIFLAIEQSGAAAAIRQSLWLYPLVNLAHILGLVVFVAAVAIMDLRLLGAFSGTRAEDIVFPARQVAVGALLVQAASGTALFVTDASHLAVNPMFLIKLGVVVLGLANALVLGRMSRAALQSAPIGAPMPPRLRIAAGLSLAIWFTVAGLGRLIAYA
jgi:hypothetical protein